MAQGMSATQNETQNQRASNVEVEPEYAGQRLDNFLLARLKGVPRSHVYRLIRSGQVRVNSGRVRANYRVCAGDRVRLPPVARRKDPETQLPQDGLKWLEERVLFEDDRLLVLDKPSGMAVHAGTGIDFGCIEALRSLRINHPGLDLVHRLDRGTSGCLLVAKRRSVLKALHALIRSGSIEKRYLALVKGSWQYGRTTVRDRLTVVRRRSGESFTRVDSSGKNAISEFRVVENYGKRATLMEVRIGTGRMHQIRVHAAHMGHPIAGDEGYGDEAFNSKMSSRGLRRLFLHANAVGFTWPDSGEEFMVGAPLPDALREVQGVLETSGSRPRSRRV